MRGLSTCKAMSAEEAVHNLVHSRVINHHVQSKSGSRGEPPGAMKTRPDGDPRQSAVVAWFTLFKQWVAGSNPVTSTNSCVDRPSSAVNCGHRYLHLIRNK